MGSSAERSTTSGSAAVAAGCWHAAGPARLLASLPTAAPAAATGGLISVADTGALSAWRLRTNQSDTCREVAPQFEVLTAVSAGQDSVTTMTTPAPQLSMLPIHAGHCWLLPTAC